MANETQLSVQIKEIITDEDFSQYLFRYDLIPSQISEENFRRYDFQKDRGGGGII